MTWCHMLQEGNGMCTNETCVYQFVPSSGEYARATSVDSSTNVSAQVPQRACQVVRDILDTNLLAIFPVNSYR